MRVKSVVGIGLGVLVTAALSATAFRDEPTKPRLPPARTSPVAPAVSPAWSAQIFADIARDQRQPQVAPGGVVLHGGELHARFDANGLVVGEAGLYTVAPPALPEIDGSRVVYRREAFTEWYEARDEGIEQGFDVAEAPS